MCQEDFEERGLWKWLAEAWAELALIPSVEERLRRIGVRFKVHKTPHGDLILLDKPNLRRAGVNDGD